MSYFNWPLDDYHSYWKLAMVADILYRDTCLLSGTVWHTVALRAYTSSQMAGLKFYLLLGNKIKMPIWGVEVFFKFYAGLWIRIWVSKMTYTWSLKTITTGQVLSVLVGSDALRISWWGFMLTGVNSLWQYKRNFTSHKALMKNSF